jgi:phytoene dehydrogenase-like protein
LAEARSYSRCLLELVMACRVGCRAPVVCHNLYRCLGTSGRWLGKAVDVIVVGGGHNGLVSAAYLSRAGKRVLVLERRHVIGGAAVTEEIIQNYLFSRASYVYSLFRPHIVRDLALHSHGLELLPRIPSSFTPSSVAGGPYLLLGNGCAADAAQISKFSVNDASAYARYNMMMERFSSVFLPMLDAPPTDIGALISATTPWRERLQLARYG